LLLCALREATPPLTKLGRDRAELRSELIAAERESITWGRDRGTARATLGQGLAVSAFPLYVPVKPFP